MNLKDIRRMWSGCPKKVELKLKIIIIFNRNIDFAERKKLEDACTIEFVIKNDN